jgi:hypothetical protein
MRNNAKAGGMEQHGMKTMTMHLMNEVVDGQ